MLGRDRVWRATYSCSSLTAVLLFIFSYMVVFFFVLAFVELFRIQICRLSVPEISPKFSSQHRSQPFHQFSSLVSHLRKKKFLRITSRGAHGNGNRSKWKTDVLFSVCPFPVSYFRSGRYCSISGVVSLSNTIYSLVIFFLFFFFL